MKWSIVIALAVVGGCIESPAVSTTADSLCSQNRDTCPNHPITFEFLKQERDRRIKQDYPTATPMGDSVYCETMSDGRKKCSITISLEGGWLLYSCWERATGSQDVDCDGDVID